ncbi:pantetheine-phosphate adenylyltransferase [Desulfonauticus submarinus]
MEKIAVYPGTFDPLTNGHVSLVKRGLKIFDTIILAIAYNSPKKTLFSLEERVNLAKEVFKNEPKVKVEPFEGLLMDYVNKKKAVAILRGLRAVSDFEYEFQMALMNRKLSPEVQTVFLMTDYKWLYISSTIVKDVASLGGSVEGLVPNSIERALKSKYAKA